MQFLLLCIWNLSLSLVQAAEMEGQNLFQHRDCRQKKWRGEIAKLPFQEILPDHPRNVIKVHSRQKRFLSFPSGSSLTFYNSFKLPVYSTTWHTVKMSLAFPLALDLPSAPLRFATDNSQRNDYYYDYDYSQYDSNEKEPGVAHYANYRSLDSQRKTGFKIVQQYLERIGLPGEKCLQRVVCEAAESPLDSVGVLGEVLNLFLAAGHGSSPPSMLPYLEAEEIGLRGGECEGSFPECPVGLSGLLMDSLSVMQNGLASAAFFSTN